MATPQEIKDSQELVANSEKLLDLSNQIIDSMNVRRKIFKGIDAEESLFLNTIRKQQSLSHDISANSEKYLGFQVKSKDLVKQIAKSEDLQNKAKQDFAKIQEKLTKQQATYEAAAEKSKKRILSRTTDIENVEDKIADLKSRQAVYAAKGDKSSVAYLQTQIKANVNEANTLIKGLTVLKQRHDRQKDIADSAKTTLELGVKTEAQQIEETERLKEQLIVRKRIESATGILGGLAKAVSKIPGIGQYLKADEAIEEMEKMAAEIETKPGQKATDFGNRLQIGLKGAKVLAVGLAENLMSPEAIFAFLLKAGDKFNKISVDVSKNFGTSATESDKITQNLTNIVNNSGELNVTLQSAAQAMSELNNSTGFVQQYSSDTLKTQIMLTKQFGLSAEAAADLYKFSVLNNKTSSQTNDEMVGAFVATRNQLKVGVPFRETMEAASKVSGQLAVNLQNNPKAIVAAVVQMKALGTTLEQAKTQGESLLNWESSIENELKAELLTGEQMNLERARAAALAGDQVTVAKELANQGMDLAKFQKMNVLQQQSFSAAVGLSSDQMAEQLKTQKLAVESGKSYAEITAAEAIKAEKRQTTQDKFNATIEKLQDFFSNLVAGPIGSLFSILADALEVVNLILLPFQLMYKLTSNIGNAIGGWIESLGVVGTILKGIVGGAILYAAYSAFKSLSEIPFGVGIPLGAAAAAAITATGFGLLNSQKIGDGAFDSSAAGGGHTVTTSEGSMFQTSKNDQIAVGPNVVDSLNNKNINSTIDMSPMIAAINEVRTAVNNLANRPVNVVMDGKKVGTILTQGSYKLA